MRQTVILVFCVNCFSQAGDLLRFIFWSGRMAEPDSSSPPEKMSGDMTAAWETGGEAGAVCLRSSHVLQSIMVLSLVLGEAKWGEQTPGCSSKIVDNQILSHSWDKRCCADKGQEQQMPEVWSILPIHLVHPFCLRPARLCEERSCRGR